MGSATRRLFRLGALTTLVLAPLVSGDAQVAFTAPGDVAPVTVQAVGLRLTGLVHDSLTGFPLSGAVVQLVAGDGANGGLTVVADAQGRFRFDDLTPGRYQLGFHHPRLDTLGIEAPVRSLVVASETHDVLLAVPSAVHIRAAVCGAGPAGQEATLILGAVYDAQSGMPAPNAKVTVEWTEVEVVKGRARANRVVRTATTGANGWYGVCDIPRAGVVQLHASTLRDSTDRVEVRVVDDALNQRLLYVGTARTARVTGVVTRDGSDRPVPDATVSLPSGLITRTNARGEFVLDAVPAGTRTLDVRALGYYPERLLVNAIADAPSVAVGLRSFRSVLDTVKVLANYERYSVRRELAVRQRMGIGRFVTEQDVMRRKPVVLSDLLFTRPGVFITPGIDLRPEVRMRGLFTYRCAPSLFLNGFAMFVADMGSAPFSFADLDAMVHPEDLLAMEIYAAGQVPPQLGMGMSGCGAIAVWTK